MDFTFSFLRTDHLFCAKPVQYFCPNINNQTNTIFDNLSPSLQGLIGDFRLLTSHLSIQVKKCQPVPLSNVKNVNKSILSKSCKCSEEQRTSLLDVRLFDGSFISV